jgi:hypothetical protein
LLRCAVLRVCAVFLAIVIHSPPGRPLKIFQAFRASSLI